MKKKLFIFFALLISLTLISTSTFAKPKDTDCKATIEKDFYEKVSASDDPGYSYIITDIKMVKQTKTTIVYELEAMGSYCDGSSSEDFPPDYYTVTVTGNEAACKIKEIKQK